jgi:hypothetical protein
MQQDPALPPFDEEKSKPEAMKTIPHSNEGK